MTEPSLTFGLNLRDASRAERISQFVEANPSHTRNSAILALIDLGFQVFTGHPPQPASLPYQPPSITPPLRADSTAWNKKPRRNGAQKRGAK